MTRRTSIAILVALALGACAVTGGFGGGVSRTAESQEIVVIAGRTCTLTEVRRNTLALGGGEARIDSRADCGGQVILCPARDRAACIARVQAALAPRV